LEALAQGLDDFAAMPSHAVFLCVVYPLIGLFLIAVVSGNALLPLAFPIAAGFALVGPFAAIGLYELSRRREAGLDTTSSHAFDVLHSRSIGAIVALGILLDAHLPGLGRGHRRHLCRQFRVQRAGFGQQIRQRRFHHPTPAGT
jgi:uncharacterized membrane protein